ncbi:Sulfotransferase family protein [Stieleria bergensis]|uniref:Sulfotransferase family protein n=1 Tax=Stieleria bergensis TaxID=2528025 RepID=A0A517STF0_9BACT|nr:Sulfotransferase family protein [Planctomycetes bacterium SV_7m_r]
MQLYQQHSAANPVLFVHIPKTAGTALFALAAKVYGRIPGRIDPRIFKLPLNWHEFDDADAIAQAIANRRDRPISFISGHCSYAILENLPFTPRVFSMLRLPSARVISAYNNMRRDPKNGYHSTAINMSLHDALKERAIPELENGQVRRIAGLPPNIGPLTQEHLEIAKHNLNEDFAVVGLTERFDETVELLRITFGWPRKGYMPWNVAPKTQNKSESSVATSQLIDERNKLDRSLYEYAEQRFDHQIAGLQPDFSVSVERTRQFNRNWYRHWHKWGIAPLRQIKRKMN